LRVRTETKRLSIIEIAGQMFMANGFAAVSMAQIAAAVGGSKATLYGYFSTKEDLFAAFVVELGKDHFADLLEGLKTEGKPLDRLISLGERYLKLALAPDIQRINRMVVAEAERLPHIGKLFFDNGPGRVIDVIKTHIAALQLPKGAFSDDAEAANVLKALLDAGLQEPTQWCVAATPTSDERRAAAEKAAQRFLQLARADLGASST
jgi:TetR/AcrR family transcriptional regulator, mexJK operon transcriptional repressor